MKITKADVDRFKSKINKNSPNGCWEWTAGRFSLTGYGQFCLRRMPRKTYLAHRVSWVMHTGSQIPKGKMICHTCDNRVCVNPMHLYCGTGYDNNSDTIKRGRGNRPRGEQCSWSKMKEKDILEIISSKEKQTVLAKRYGLDQSTVSQIKSGIRWKHLHQKTV